MNSDPVAQDATGFSTVKRPGLICRYFLNSGDCFYGPNCQYSHEMPVSRPGAITTAETLPQVTDEGFDGGNADQYFTATFQGVDGKSSLNEHRPHSYNDLSAAGHIAPPVTTVAMPTSEFVPVNSQSLMNNDSVRGMRSTYPAAFHPAQFGAQLNSDLAPRGASSSPLHSHTRSPDRSSVHNASSFHAGISLANSGVAVQEDVGGTTYFYVQDESSTETNAVPASQVVPQFTVFSGMPPHIAHLKLKPGVSPSFFMHDELKMEILNRQLFTALQLDSSHSQGVPAEVDNYHKLYPLEPLPTDPLHKSNTFGYTTSVYKAVNTKDGLTYCLRRIHGFRLVNTKCMSDIELWKKILHPNLVHLREVFTTKAFGDNSMVFVYDFHPGAETMMSRHFGSSARSSDTAFGNHTGSTYRSAGGEPVITPGGSPALPEALIWSYIVQLSSVLRTIHAHGLACRVMDPTKILLMDKTRIRLNCVGVFDVVSFDPNLQSGSTQMERYKQEDLTSLGRVVLTLANSSVHCLQNLTAAMVFVSRAYSADLKNLILYLISPQPRPRNINDVMPMIGARFYSQLDATHLCNDVLEHALSREVENGRLFKLLCKLGTINERPEYNMDASWCETGDRYLLKLFRDYLFHQVNADGTPWIDMAHVIQCLNKLNAGVAEKLCLSSRDDDIVLVVSYAELKRCVETSFAELAHSKQTTNNFS